MAEPLHDLALVWLRRDLRLYDHHALSQAECAAKRVAVCFVFDTVILDALHDADDRRVTFIHDSLKELDAALRERGSMLVVRYGDPKREIPLLAQTLGTQAVYTNRDYESYAIERDQDVKETLVQRGIAFHSFKDQVVFDTDEVLTKQGHAYGVFTPYQRAWIARIGDPEFSQSLREHAVLLTKLLPAEELQDCCHRWELSDIGFTRNTLWLKPGSIAGQDRLRAFMRRIDRYADWRDFPSEDAVSGLSVHLRFGTVSVRHCFSEAMRKDSEGAHKWVSELIWREFYQMILSQYPHVETGAWKRAYHSLAWEGTEAQFQAWCQGRTGYPLVDAAMRHFNQTGWMHNRLRMVVAVFLCKDLLIDWRKGEEYFARYLLDFDLAANNGGWQWCASTGVDAQPYFRIFNPVTQSQKFDPEGVYIRKYVPELRHFTNRSIHFPAAAKPIEQAAAQCIIGQDYPEPIVNHSVQIQKAKAMFKRSA